MQYGDSANESFKLKTMPRSSPIKMKKEDLFSKPQTIMQVSAGDHSKFFTL